MHIKEISLEGFKSYATRTVVSGFDPFFNAITGLNGSGKSNILDSICFVLGITNLQQVRATNLQELVYKQGQAGITKATVSIIFDNSDRSRSPLGYEGCPEITVTRQIVVGGRNKYLINGHLAQPSRVQTLFHSVQLNVNNPHFLIMQGRITKVLNMKPPEILSMLEEAAGTKMYEMKKESALKTLEKKQSKLDEMDKLLDQEILPSLEKLRKERMQYMQWANGNAELDRLKRFCIAYEYVQAEKVRDSAVSGVEQIKIKITELDDKTERTRKDLEEMERNLSNLISDKEAKLGGEVRKLSLNVDELSRSLVKETSIMSNQEESLRSEQNAAKKIGKSIDDLKRSVVEKDSAVHKVVCGAADLKERVEELSKNLHDSEKEYQGVLAGKSSMNEEKCLEDQLRDAKAAVGNFETELKQLKTKISHAEKEHKTKSAQLKSKRDEAAAVEKELSDRKKDLENIKSSLESIGCEEGQMEALQKDRSMVLEEIQKLKDGIRILSGPLANIEFNYRDPIKNFDRSSIKGVVARLVTIKDRSTMTALEVAAGGKLFNVVVDTENTGKQLLQNGDLRRRVTIIPLNKIQYHIVPARVQQVAASLVGEHNAELALLLVGYDDEVKNAMAYVFGSTFVCRSAEAAKEIAFNRDINTTSVTLEGDIFQPSGLLTGGSRKGGGELLRQLHELAEKESELSVLQNRLSEIEDKITKLLPLHKKFMHFKSQLELKSYDLSLFQSRAEQNEHHKLGELVKKLEQEIEETKQCAEQKQHLLEKQVSNVRELENLIREHVTHRERMLKELDKRIKVVKADLQSTSKQMKSHENEKERLVLEKDAVLQELASLETQLSSSEKQIISLTKALDDQKSVVSSIKKEHIQAESELQMIYSKMKECDSQIRKISKEQQKLQQQQSDANVERKKLENEVKRMELEQKDCSLRVDRLLEKHGWITSEKQLFGKSGTDYDFSSRDLNRAKEEYEKLQSEQASLEKRINKKVIAMFEKAEEEYNSLILKKNIIENDKAKIKKVIEELDEKKKETLKVTWVKVNKDFGSIFSTLLPGTMSKLQPPEGCSFLDGLEVRVAFGSVWKQSLSELSGGQRSLLALSLILALLLYKPAPLYILDEVDAALDLSHTQNIGRMIKAHFPHSQFIVVSLKEGMFNNANVLFRTKFVDGVSTVTRTVASKEK
ncbi:structural maintenance of chromosomes protein 2-1-like [Phalaenopsis equestris]|uniref:structural maintenance of chromosomes protein 2-1-like n=1 Tax=Phalaenopsis equestris TaxID=78828 RepID=UPI0009E59454|nr:structural maintenance of chromosomes protein 2-1-like [Phalaenopsis equestris]